MSHRPRGTNTQGLSMEAKIDLILAAQDVQEVDLKEMKKDIKQLKVDVGILPKIQEQMKSFKTNVRVIKDNINTNKASILTLEARIDEISEANEALQKDLNLQRKPKVNESLMQDKSRSMSDVSARRNKLS